MIVNGLDERLWSPRAPARVGALRAGGHPVYGNGHARRGSGPGASRAGAPTKRLRRSGTDRHMGVTRAQPAGIRIRVGVARRRCLASYPGFVNWMVQRKIPAGSRPGAAGRQRLQPLQIADQGAGLRGSRNGGPGLRLDAYRGSIADGPGGMLVKRRRLVCRDQPAPAGPALLHGLARRAPRGPRNRHSGGAGGCAAPRMGGIACRSRSRHFGNARASPRLVLGGGPGRTSLAGSGFRFLARPGPAPVRSSDRARPAAFFDPAWFLASYPNVSALGGDALPPLEAISRWRAGSIDANPRLLLPFDVLSAIVAGSYSMFAGGRAVGRRCNGNNGVPAAMVRVSSITEQSGPPARSGTTATHRDKVAEMDRGRNAAREGSAHEPGRTRDRLYQRRPQPDPLPPLILPTAVLAMALPDAVRRGLRARSWRSRQPCSCSTGCSRCRRAGWSSGSGESPDDDVLPGRRPTLIATGFTDSPLTCAPLAGGDRGSHRDLPPIGTAMLVEAAGAGPGAPSASTACSATSAWRWRRS